MLIASNYISFVAQSQSSFYDTKKLPAYATTVMCMHAPWSGAFQFSLSLCCLHKFSTNSR